MTTACFFETMNATRIPQKQGRPRTRPYALVADKGYSSQTNKKWLKSLNVTPVIPTKSNQAQDPIFFKTTYKRRNIVERTIGLKKQEEAPHVMKNLLLTFWLWSNSL